ncbi:ABC transporter permease subunit [Alphaproteobacteria bacterium GH1-50]|uniref:ABC transporter permease subunit n=1 Tax=Kangsaoukella pontilimi TaxID=2691042 RepID=A0A7C9MXF2_9RHOB|nr:thiamine/thiamine pyrophosphate ABC transporter permease ThiP [Kangsaoukella pontilimi]MXQ08334.1 ABC transporter permease subunit [Kangsaoukella pontilimi]
MAERAQPLTGTVAAGLLAAAAIPALILVTGGAVLTKATGASGLGPGDWAAIRFTLLQAALSALFSVALAVPVARALARRRFAGRSLLVALLGAPFLLPTIVAIFGLLAIFGRGGVLNAGLVALGFEPVSIYGLWGVVLAHVFFNLPLATRLFLQGWLDVPSERLRLAASLGMGPGAIFRHIELPMLARTAPGALLVIFVISTTSFAVALTLGGGPRATTVELAIYQAVSFEFDLGRAALLSAIQLGLTGAAALFALSFVGHAGFGAGLDRPTRRWDGKGAMTRTADSVAICLAALFLILPLAAVLIAGLPALISLPDVVWWSAIRSLGVAAASTLLVVALTLAMARAAVRRRSLARPIEGAALLAIAASPLVLGTGLFILVFPFADPTRLALPVTALVNAIVTVPFALRAVLPAWQKIEADHGRLAASLGLKGWARLRLVELPRLARPLGFSAGVAAALSMGDLGVIALFADSDTATLPLQVYRLMGAYRMEDAAGAALLLMLVSFALFWLFDRGGRVDADA